MKPRTISDILQALPSPPGNQLPAPCYEMRVSNGSRVGLAVESMRHHMSDEGWVVFHGLREAGWELVGFQCPDIDSTDVSYILDVTKPHTVLMQDKREWDLTHRDFREPRARFTNVQRLKGSGVFVGTILKDSHQRPGYHRESAEEIGCHYWVIYYSPEIVKHVAPYIRPEHCIRTYHSVDPALCISSLEKLAGGRQDQCCLSGAVSAVYPLRKRLIAERYQIPRCLYLPHPGYHRNGCCTPAFLRQLNQCKVSICTTSIYGYALRKILESVACSCICITDLPADEIIPEIDEALVRVPSTISTQEMAELVRQCYREWDPERQSHYAEKAKKWYDWRAVGQRLSDDIEALRKRYI